MTDANWIDRLSEYLDGTLTSDEVVACEAWLATSEDGRALLADLRRVVAKAKTLPDAPVPESVWAGVSTAIGQQTLGRSKRVVPISPRASERPSTIDPARRWQFSPLQLAMAAAILLAVGIGIGVKVRFGVKTPVAGNTDPTQEQFTNVSRTPSADARYDEAIQELQTILDQNRAILDTTTVRVLESSLAKIDVALVEAQWALAQDRNSEYLNDHLSRIKRKKLDLLRQAAALVQAS
jgi:hypothetical protein